jgi:hypothetical protein
MSNPEHIALLRRGVQVWNENRPEWPDLVGADLSGLDLTGISFHGAQISDSVLRRAKLDGAMLQGAFLSGSDLTGASLRGANLYFTRLLHANLTDCDLARAKVVGATLDGATLIRASLSGANLQNAHLSQVDATECDFSDCSLVAASLVNTNLTRANLARSILGGASLVRAIVEDAVFDNAFVYGVGAWDLIGRPKSSENLRISSAASVTVTDLRVAQFVYLMLENAEIRTIIDTLTSKVVLILGRFFEARKHTLDALKTELRVRGFVPVIFDFEQPADRDVTETVTLLARNRATRRSAHTAHDPRITGTICDDERFA